MIINKKSWHYKLVDAAFDYVPSGLCAYMRRVLAGILIAIVAAVALCTAACSLVAFPLALFGLAEAAPKTFHHFLTMLGGGIYAVALFIGVLAGLGWLRDKWRYRERPFKPYVAPKPPGLVRSWLKAKKDKLCPMIEFI